MPLEVPVKQTGLEASIDAAAKKAGRSLSINLGKSAKSIDTLSQPLGRITGRADEFTKSMEAANARVLAFGASVGVLTTVTKAFKDLVTTTIQVEKQLTSINTILGGTASSLSKFSGEIFNVARNTEQSFAVVADAALELSRQGLESEQVVKRLNDALILSRLTGQGAAEAVSGLTAAINSFNSTGITSSEVLNKLSSAAISAAVSERDLIEGIKRSGSVAVQAGVSFDELVGIIGAVQEKTARGGAVIGNSFKTIFTRIQSLDKLETMQNLGVQVTDASGEILSATKLIQNLGSTLQSLPDAKRLQIAENLVGKFQIAPFLAILEDFNSQQSKAIELTGVSQNASTEAYQRNITLNKTLSAAINEASVSLTELANNLGKIGVTDGLKQILDTVNGALEGLKGMFDEESGSSIAKSLVKGIGNVLSGPGVAIFLAIIGKLTFELAKFGVGSLRTFFGINKAAKEQAALQGSIASSLLNNSSIQKQILAIENSSLSAADKKKQQTQFFTTALNEQYGIMLKMQQIAGRVAPGVMAGTRGRRGAGGYIPSMAMGSAIGSAIGQEQADINRGVGGAPSSAKAVPIPNFNFGGGQRGTIVANDSEFIVPSFGGGSAIFNQDMASSMGLPRGAKKIGAARGYIPNFAKSKTVAEPEDKRLNAAGNLVLFTGSRGDDGDVTMFVGKAGKDTKAYTSRPPSGGKIKSIKEVRVPIYKVGPEGQNQNVKGFSGDIETIKGGLAEAGSKQAKVFAKEIAEKEKLPTLSNKQIEGLFNPGAFEGFAGSVFEVALSAILESKPFLDYASRTSTSRIDLPYSPRLFGKFKVPEKEGKMGAEVKANDGTELLKGAAVKFYDILYGGEAVAAFRKERKIDKDTTRRNFLGETVGQKDAQKIIPGITPQTYSALTKKIQADRGRGAALTRGDLMLIKDRRNLGAASGYVPNFVGALENAIGREAAAGLPINQIRINQSGSLRNASNPMGLAVTNMRDEPTGAIPNFSNGGGFRIGKSGFAASGVGPVISDPPKVKREHAHLTKSGREVIKTNKEVADSNKKVKDKNDKTAKASGDMLGKIFAVQAGLSLLSGATADAEDGVGRFTNRLSSGLGSLTTAAFAASALKDLGKDVKGFKGALGRFTAGTGMAVAGVFALTGVLNAANGMYEDSNGITDQTSKAMARLKDRVDKAGDAFAKLTAVEQENIKRELREGIGKGEGFGTRILASAQSMLGLDFGIAQNKDRLFTQDIQTGGQIEISKTQQDALENIILQLRGRGIDQDLIEDTIKRIASSDNVQADATFGGLQRFFTFGRASGKVEDSQIVSQEEFLNIEKELISLLDVKIDKQLALEKSRERANRIAQKQAAEEALAARVNASVGLENIRVTIEKAKLNKDALEAAEEELRFQQASGVASKSQLVGVKARVDLLKLELDFRNKAFDSVFKMAKTTQELTLKTEDEKNLREALTKATKDGVLLDEERANINKLINKLLEEGTSIKATELNQLRNNIDLNNILLNQEKEKLKKRKEREEFEAKLEDRNKADDASSRAFISRGFFDETNPKKRRVSEIEAEIGGIGQGARTILQGRSDAVRKAGLEAEKAKLENELAASELLKSQIKQAANFLDDKQFGSLAGEGTAIMREGDPKSFADIQKLIQETIKRRSEEAGGAEAERNLNKLFTQFKQTATEQIEDRDKAAKSLNDLSKNAQNAAAALGDLLTESEIKEDMATRLREGKNQAMVEARLSIDPAARAKGLFSAGRRERKAKALDDDNETLFRQLLQEELLAGQLIDASQQFAQNIGNAMLDAISKGESLGDTLLAAASGFFDQMSRSLMNNAVNSIISGGPGGAGFFGGFGKMLGLNTGGRVSGGSGVRDDVPALLTGGEFVMSKKAVQNYGAGFMGALNSGAVPKYANGGLFTPGTFGQGSIKGSSNLLRFATQSYTGGMQDQFLAGAGIAGLALEPQSGRLTMFGRRNSPAFQREQDSKRKAFDLFAQQYSKDADRRRQKEQNSGNLLGSILGFGFSLGANALFGGGLSGIFSKGKATGGAIPYSAGVDSVPAMLSGGEFVMNAAATQRLGAGNLAALNSGGGVASGDNSQIVGKLDQLNETIASSNTEINITVNSNGTENTDSPNAPQQQRNLATRIKDVVRQVIEDEKRLGGSLRMA